MRRRAKKRTLDPPDPLFCLGCRGPADDEGVGKGHGGGEEGEHEEAARAGEGLGVEGRGGGV